VVGGAERIEEALGGGRGKDLADGHGVDQAGADVAEESRLMARAAAGDDADAPWPDGLALTMTRGLVSYWRNCGCATRMPRSMSSTTWSGSLMTRFITRVPVFLF